MDSRSHSLESKSNTDFTILIVFIFFIQYLGVGFYAHIMALVMIGWSVLIGGKRAIFTAVDYYFFLSVLAIFTIKALGISVLNDILLLKFYWGFIIFYVFYRISGFKLDFKLLFILTCIITIIDFTLINTIVPVGMMKNVPGGERNISASELQGWYHRTYGLASSPTASATVLVALLAAIYYYTPLQFKNKHILYAIPPLLMLSSGTGFVLFIIFIFFKFKIYKGYKFLLGTIAFIIIVTMSFAIANSESGGLLSRLSVNYFDFLIDFKIEQIIDVVNKLTTPLEKLFGYNYAPNEGLRVMSDFGWLDMVEAYGYLGTAILLVYIAIKKKYNNILVILLLIGISHYPGAFSIPGQIIFAAALAYSKSDYEIQPYNSDRGLLKS